VGVLALLLHALGLGTFAIGDAAAAADALALPVRGRHFQMGPELPGIAPVLVDYLAHEGLQWLILEATEVLKEEAYKLLNISEQDMHHLLCSLPLALR